MDGQGFHFASHSRVRLRNTVDPAVYGDFACIGNEGWIKDRREDRFGLPEVLIEWDKNHWAYNGIPDCWTFEEHFELVESNMDKSNKQQQAHAYVQQFAEAMASLFSEEEKPEPKQEVGDLAARFANAGRLFSPPEEDPYKQAVAAASQRLAESDGFIIVGVDRRPDPGSPNGVLDPFAFAFAKDPKAELSVQAHLAGVSARAHQELALQVIAQESDE